MPIERYHSGSTFEKEVGYARAVKVDQWILVSGTTGYDYHTMEISEDIVQQTRQCLRNIETALTQFDAQLKDIVRVRYILSEASSFSLCWPVLKAAFGTSPPTATMWQAQLVDPKMKIEIECTAFVGRG